VTERHGFTEIALGELLGNVLRATRSSRLPNFVAVTDDPGKVLDQLKVALVGVGSVGGNIGMHLARMQIAWLGLIDPARFKAESLITQPILPDAVGQPKAVHIGRLCKQISPSTRVSAFVGRFQELPPSALAEADVIVMATDNLEVEVAVGEWCLKFRKPLIHASVGGETLVAQVRFFANRDGQGPCPACLFGAQEWGLLDSQVRFKCELTADEQPVRADQPQPTMSISPLCSLAADLALMQLLRRVLKLGKPVEDTLLEYAGYRHATTVSPLVRKEDCRCDHDTVWTAARAPRPLAECTLRELGTLAAVGDSSFSVDELRFAETGLCRCGARRPLARFVGSGGLAGKCPSCHAPVQAEAFRSHRRVPARLLDGQMDRTLADIGAGEARWVVVSGDERAVVVEGS
jgi:molybdopterin/thiamine biosynthesis adenylyltransferase